jgi:hypothetical protein
MATARKKPTAAQRQLRAVAPISKRLALVRSIALALPETTERSVHGTPGFYVGPKLFVWTLRDGASLALWMDFAERATRVASEPDVFAVTPHYEKHPMVVVRLAKAKRAVLEQVIAGSWQARAPRSVAKRHSI